MRKAFKATNVVLLLLCLMYFITYVDRVNIGTAASAIKQEMHLSNTELGLVFSAFAYPYLLFQVFGGWVGDRFGARSTLFICGGIWALATILTGLAGSLLSLFAIRFLLGFGEGATFPTATRAMQNWTTPEKRGFAQGITHSFARLGNAITPPVVALIVTAISWRASFVILGFVSLAWVIVWLWYFRDDPKDHAGITPTELASLPVRAATKPTRAPWGPLIRRIAPVTLTYFCYGWTLWLYLNWLPSFFKYNYNLDLKKSALFASAVFFAGVIGDTAGGLISDFILHRTGRVRLARIGVIFIGFVGAFATLMPIMFSHDITTVSICLSLGFFFAEVVIGPIWAIPMHIAPKYAGTAAGLMNTGSAFAAIVSPLVAGFVIDLTGNWLLPFIMTIALLIVGAVACFFMHPEIPFEEPVAGESDAVLPAPAS